MSGRETTPSPLGNISWTLMSKRRVVPLGLLCVILVTVNIIIYTLATYETYLSDDRNVYYDHNSTLHLIKKSIIDRYLGIDWTGRPCSRLSVPKEGTEFEMEIDWSMHTYLLEEEKEVDEVAGPTVWYYAVEMQKFNKPVDQNIILFCQVSLGILLLSITALVLNWIYFKIFKINLTSLRFSKFLCRCQRRPGAYGPAFRKIMANFDCYVNEINLNSSNLDWIKDHFVDDWVEKRATYREWHNFAEPSHQFVPGYKRLVNQGTFEIVRIVYRIEVNRVVYIELGKDASRVNEENCVLKDYVIVDADRRLANGHIVFQPNVVGDVRIKINDFVARFFLVGARLGEYWCHLRVNTMNPDSMKESLEQDQLLEFLDYFDPEKKEMHNVENGGELRFVPNHYPGGINQYHLDYNMCPPNNSATFLTDTFRERHFFCYHALHNPDLPEQLKAKIRDSGDVPSERRDYAPIQGREIYLSWMQNEFTLPIGMTRCVEEMVVDDDGESENFVKQQLFKQLHQTWLFVPLILIATLLVAVVVGTWNNELTVTVENFRTSGLEVLGEKYPSFVQHPIYEVILRKADHKKRFEHRFEDDNFRIFIQKKIEPPVKSNWKLCEEERSWCRSETHLSFGRGRTDYWAKNVLFSEEFYDSLNFTEPKKSNVTEVRSDFKHNMTVTIFDVHYKLKDFPLNESLQVLNGGVLPCHTSNDSLLFWHPFAICGLNLSCHLRVYEGIVKRYSNISGNPQGVLIGILSNFFETYVPLFLKLKFERISSLWSYLSNGGIIISILANLFLLKFSTGFSQLDAIFTQIVPLYFFLSILCKYFVVSLGLLGLCVWVVVAFLVVYHRIVANVSYMKLVRTLRIRAEEENVGGYGFFLLLGLVKAGYDMMEFVFVSYGLTTLTWVESVKEQFVNMMESPSVGEMTTLFYLLPFIVFLSLAIVCSPARRFLLAIMCCCMFLPFMFLDYFAVVRTFWWGVISPIFVVCLPTGGYVLMHYALTWVFFNFIKFYERIIFWFYQPLFYSQDKRPVGMRLFTWSNVVTFVRFSYCIYVRNITGLAIFIQVAIKVLVTYPISGIATSLVLVMLIFSFLTFLVGTKLRNKVLKETLKSNRPAPRLYIVTRKVQERMEQQQVEALSMTQAAKQLGWYTDMTTIVTDPGVVLNRNLILVEEATCDRLHQDMIPGSEEQGWMFSFLNFFRETQADEKFHFENFLFLLSKFNLLSGDASKDLGGYEIGVQSCSANVSDGRNLTSFEWSKFYGAQKRMLERSDFSAPPRAPSQKELKNAYDELWELLKDKRGTSFNLPLEAIPLIDIYANILYSNLLFTLNLPKGFLLFMFEKRIHMVPEKKFVDCVKVYGTHILRISERKNDCPVKICMEFNGRGTYGFGHVYNPDQQGVCRIENGAMCYAAHRVNLCDYYVGVTNMKPQPVIFDFYKITDLEYDHNNINRFLQSSNSTGVKLSIEAQNLWQVFNNKDEAIGTAFLCTSNEIEHRICTAAHVHMTRADNKQTSVQEFFQLPILSDVPAAQKAAADKSKNGETIEIYVPNVGKYYVPEVPIFINPLTKRIAYGRGAEHSNEAIFWKTVFAFEKNDGFRLSENVGIPLGDSNLLTVQNNALEVINFKSMEPDDLGNLAFISVSYAGVSGAPIIQDKIVRGLHCGGCETGTAASYALVYQSQGKFQCSPYRVLGVPSKDQEEWDKMDITDYQEHPLFQTSFVNKILSQSNDGQNYGTIPSDYSEYKHLRDKPFIVLCRYKEMGEKKNIWFWYDPKTGVITPGPSVRSDAGQEKWNKILKEYSMERMPVMVRETGKITEFLKSQDEMIEEYLMSSDGVEIQSIRQTLEGLIGGVRAAELRNMTEDERQQAKRANEVVIGDLSTTIAEMKAQLQSFRKTPQFVHAWSEYKQKESQREGSKETLQLVFNQAVKQDEVLRNLRKQFHDKISVRIQEVKSKIKQDADLLKQIADLTKSTNQNYSLKIKTIADCIKSIARGTYDEDLPEMVKEKIVQLRTELNSVDEQLSTLHARKSSIRDGLRETLDPFIKQHAELRRELEKKKKDLEETMKLLKETAKSQNEAVSSSIKINRGIIDHLNAQNRDFDSNISQLASRNKAIKSRISESKTKAKPPTFALEQGLMYAIDSLTKERKTYANYVAAIETLAATWAEDKENISRDDYSNAIQEEISERKIINLQAMTVEEWDKYIVDAYPGGDDASSKPEYAKILEVAFNPRTKGRMLDNVIRNMSGSALSTLEQLLRITEYEQVLNSIFSTIKREITAALRMVGELNELQVVNMLAEVCPCEECRAELQLWFINERLGAYAIGADDLEDRLPELRKEKLLLIGVFDANGAELVWKRDGLYSNGLLRVCMHNTQVECQTNKGVNPVFMLIRNKEILTPMIEQNMMCYVQPASVVHASCSAAFVCDQKHIGDKSTEFTGRHMFCTIQCMREQNSKLRAHMSDCQTTETPYAHGTSGPENNPASVLCTGRNSHEMKAINQCFEHRDRNTPCFSNNARRGEYVQVVVCGYASYIDIRCLLSILLRKTTPHKLIDCRAPPTSREMTLISNIIQNPIQGDGVPDLFFGRKLHLYLISDKEQVTAIRSELMDMSKCFTVQDEKSVEPQTVKTLVAEVEKTLSSGEEIREIVSDLTNIENIFSTDLKNELVLKVMARCDKMVASMEEMRKEHDHQIQEQLKKMEIPFGQIEQVVKICSQTMQTVSQFGLNLKQQEIETAKLKVLQKQSNEAAVQQLGSITGEIDKKIKELEEMSRGVGEGIQALEQVQPNLDASTSEVAIPDVKDLEVIAEKITLQTVLICDSPTNTFIAPPEHVITKQSFLDRWAGREQVLKVTSQSLYPVDLQGEKVREFSKKDHLYIPAIAQQLMELGETGPLQTLVRQYVTEILSERESVKKIKVVKPREQRAPKSKSQK